MIDINDVPVLIGILITVVQLLLIVTTSIKIRGMIKNISYIKKYNKELPGMYTFWVLIIGCFLNSGIISLILCVLILGYFLLNVMLT